MSLRDLQASWTLGRIARNLRDGSSASVQWHEVEERQAAGATVLDVRSAAEHAKGGCPGSINVPVDELRDRLDELPDGELLVHCGVGIRSHVAVSLLRAAGRDAYNMSGGYRTWRAGRDWLELTGRATGD